jgi:hypothetical protein
MWEFITSLQCKIIWILGIMLISLSTALLHHYTPRVHSPGPVKLVALVGLVGLPGPLLFLLFLSDLPAGGRPITLAFLLSAPTPPAPTPTCPTGLGVGATLFTALSASPSLAFTGTLSAACAAAAACALFLASTC